MTEMLFILAQIFGVLGTVAILASFQLNHKHRLLWMQILSCIFYIGQYLCLNAFAGCLMNFVAMIRNFAFSRHPKSPRILMLIFVVAALFTTAIQNLISFEGPISLLPCLATIIYTIGLSGKNMTAVRLADLLACALYLIYNLNVSAYAGAVATVLEASSTLIAMFRFDRRQKH